VGSTVDCLVFVDSWGPVAPNDPDGLFQDPSVVPGSTDRLLRRIVFSEYKGGVQMDTSQGGGNGIDFPDNNADSLFSISYNTRGIPSAEDGSSMVGRIWVENARGEGYWVQVTPVGNVTLEKYKG